MIDMDLKNKNQFEFVLQSTQNIKETHSVASQEKRTTHKQKITAFLLLLHQMVVAIIYGIFFQVPTQATPINNIGNVLQLSFLFVLIILGFGLIFSYYHHLAWTSIGFPLFIAALCVESYFLFNALFSVISLYTDQYANLSKYPIFLTANQTYNYEGTLRQAIKCSLSCIVAFSCIVGRVGLLEAFLLSIFGSAGYQLSRVLCLLNNKVDLGTFKIFCYGSAMGLMISLLLKRNQIQIKENPRLSPNTQSQTFCLVGLCLYLTLFPLLAEDNENTTLTTGQLIPILLSMTVSTILGITLSVISGKFMTLVVCSLAGGVAILSSPIDFPYLGIFFGLVSGFFQIGVITIDSKLSGKYGIIDNFKLVFIAQSIFGIFWAFIAKIILLEDRGQASYEEGYRILGAGWLCVGIGLGFGLILGILFSLIVYHYKYNESYYYSDKQHWDREDEEERKDSEIDSVEYKNQVMKEYKFWNYSKIKQTHSFL